MTAEKAEPIVDAKRDKILLLQKRMYALSGLPEQHIKHRDVYIGEREYIHCTEIDVTPREGNNTLVLVHGYGGANSNYFRMVRHLANEFHLVAVDLPGMALSSKTADVVAFEDTRGCVDYFVRRLHSFFDAMHLQKFSIAGHSLGGYIATHYFDKHSERVDKLILLSPAGMNKSDPSQERKVSEWVNKLPFLKRMWINYARQQLFGEKRSIMDLLYTPWRKYMLNHYFGNKRFTFSAEELALIVDFHAGIYSYPSVGERCLGYLLDHSVKSKLPSMDVLERHGDRAKDVIIMYGEHDFMDKQDTMDGLQQRGLDIGVKTIRDADHQIINQNPEQVCELRAL